MERWRDAILVTPRNIVRVAWNNQSALRHAIDTNKQVIISPSLDKGLTCDRRQMVWTPDSKTEFLPTWSVLCIDGPAMVTANVGVELEIANGTDVIVRQVIPHPDDRQGWAQITKQFVQLSRPPICVFIEPVEKADLSLKFGSYPEGWFALSPITERMQAPKEWGTTKLFNRTQTPLVPRFAKSDYKVNIELYNGLTHKVQGSTMESEFIADIARPPTGRIGLRNLYVILSRATSFEKLAILRPFDDQVFVEEPDDNLEAFETRLEEKNQEVQSQYERGHRNT